jgi:hypothetical protein
MIYLIIWAHFISDFILQTDSMAKNKSSSNYWLGSHIFCYTFYMYCFIILCAWSVSVERAALYCVVNGAAHFVTDYVTSRMTKKLWAEKKVHDFFVVIGCDQAIHMTTLVATLGLFKL